MSRETAKTATFGSPYGASLDADATTSLQRPRVVRLLSVRMRLAEALLNNIRALFEVVLTRASEEAYVRNARRAEKLSARRKLVDRIAKEWGLL